jgi:hypothetical protein
MSKWLDVHLVGRGVYGASRNARKRFDVFPSLFADDKFFDSQYDETEKVTVSDALVTIWTPTTLRQLVRNETRVARGNRQAATYFSREQRVESVDAKDSVPLAAMIQSKARTLRQWARDVKTADYAPLLVYLSVTATTRLSLVLLRLRQKQVSWR